MIKTSKIFQIIALFAFIVLSISLSSKTTLASSTYDDWEIVIKEELQMPDKVWNIELTDELDEVTVNTDNVYVLDSEYEKVDDIEVKLVNDRFIQVIPKEEYTQGEVYFLCVSRDVLSKNGGRLPKPYMIQYKINNVDSDFFKIRTIQPISKNIINVYFTQPVGKEAEQATFYEILKDGQEFVKGSYKNMDIKLLPDDDKGISIYIKDNEFLRGKHYTLKIEPDLVSKYDIHLLNGFGDSMNFTGNDQPNVNIDIKGIKAISKDTIQIEFNKEVDYSSAQRIGNYSIRDSKGILIGPVSAVVSEDHKKVSLKVVNEIKDSETYNININNIKDSIKDTVLQNEDFKISFKINNEEFKVKAASALYNNIAVVFFSNLPNKDDVENPSYYYITGITDSDYYLQYPIKVFYDPEENPYIAKLYMHKKFKSSKQYNLTVLKELSDSMGNTQDKDSNLKFYGVSIDETPLSIEEVVIVGDKQIKVKFNKEIIDSDSNMNTSNYELESHDGENRKIILSCSDVNYVDSKTMVLTFEGINFDEDYLLKIKSLTDFIGNTTNIYASGINVIMGE